ncbi:MAG TPA: VTT domain-containing protein [Thermomicrobiales bacterium]|nr:VTT domain-containing protein [Thermomicrobiales bacterium]
MKIKRGDLPHDDVGAGCDVIRRYALIALGIAIFVLASFLLVEALHIPLLVDPSNHLEKGGFGAAALGVGLLIVDVVLPVPSSLVMTAQGALFGIVVGTILSMIGSIGAAMVGYGIGRKSTRLIARFVTPEEQAQSNRLINRWGPLALIVTRPVPVLAETTAIMAGTSSLTWRQVLIGVTIGAFPASLIYAIAGAYATSVASGLLVFVLVIVLAGAFWAIGWYIEKRFLLPRRNTAVARQDRH